MKSIVQSLIDYLNGWRFGFQIFLVILSINLIMFSMFLVPTGESALSQFATDFKVWCFGYDPHSDQSQIVYILGFLMESFVVAGFVWVYWKRRIFMAFHHERPAFFLQIALVFSIILATSATYYNFYTAKISDAVPIFPSAALRTSFNGPQFSLINHRNEKVTQDNFKGTSLVITAFYAHCTSMCPTILNQLKEIYSKVNANEQEKINFLVITMDPEKDDVETLKDMSDGYDLNRSNVHFVTGDPVVVNKLLDQLSFSRQRNKESGEIDHAGLYLVLDNNYKIAYRFTAGKLQEKWMLEAIQILTKEVKVAKANL